MAFNNVLCHSMFLEKALHDVLHHKTLNKFVGHVKKTQQESNRDLQTFQPKDHYTNLNLVPKFPFKIPI